MTAGLIAYFMGSKTHSGNLAAAYKNLPQTGYYWTQAVRQYVEDLSYIRPSSGSYANVIYNGEIPLQACPATSNGKRQGGSCPLSPASASALSASAASASVASASLASVASVSAVSVSSAEARSSRLATMTAPPPSFTGYLGDNCNSNQGLVLDTGVANTTIKQFCTGFWSWVGPGIPPNNLPVGEGETSLSGGNITYKDTPPSSPNLEISTELIVGPYDGPGACKSFQFSTYLDTRVP